MDVHVGVYVDVYVGVYVDEYVNLDLYLGWGLGTSVTARFQFRLNCRFQWYFT